MSEYTDLIQYLFKGDASSLHKKVVRLTGTAVPTAATYPLGTFCVIDYPGDDSDHDIYLYCEATVDTAGWALVHNET
jgi:hypothetical protein